MKRCGENAVRNVVHRVFTFTGKYRILFFADYCFKDRRELMKCPSCGEENTKVIDSRPADDNSSIRRRRQCEKCGKRFTTYEKLETMPLMVIKKDNSREVYDRSKIEAGILRSCHKRPVSSQQINAMVDEIENWIFNLEEKEVETSAIGEKTKKEKNRLCWNHFIRKKWWNLLMRFPIKSYMTMESGE